MSNLETALKNLAQGRPVLVYDADGREEETDIIYASQFITHDKIRILRTHGGGLVCTTIPSELADRIGLPFLVDVYRNAKAGFPLLNLAIPDNLPYDTKSAFSLTINHKRNYTGITDKDRAMTATEFAKFVEDIISGAVPDERATEAFSVQFRIPGHLHILRAADGLLNARKGHTELATAMCEMAGTIPSATICEMLGDDGHALPREKARAFAQANDYDYLDGSDIIGGWDAWSE